MRAPMLCSPRLPHHVEGLGLVFFNYLLYPIYYRMLTCKLYTDTDTYNFFSDSWRIWLLLCITQGIDSDRELCFGWCGTVNRDLFRVKQDVSRYVPGLRYFLYGTRGHGLMYSQPRRSRYKCLTCVYTISDNVMAALYVSCYQGNGKL